MALLWTTRILCDANYLRSRFATEGTVTLGVTLCVCPPSRGEGIALHLECF